MAIRTNTIEYGWETDIATYAAGTSATVASRSVFIPEMTDRVFTNVSLIVSARLATTVNNSAGSVLAGCGIDNISTASLLIPSFANQTVEHITYTYHVPFTSYFNTNFTSSNHVVKTYCSPSLEAIEGLTYKLICTYQFDDDSQNTSIKTVRLPINSITGSALTTTNVYLGNYTGSIPALDSYLPETSKVYRDIFIEYHASDAATATTNYSLRETIDDGSVQNRFLVSQSLNSSAYYYDIHNLSGSIDTATTHSIRVNSSTATRFTGLYGILYVTYEYNYTGSNRIMNSCIYPFKNSTPMIAITSSVQPEETFLNTFDGVEVLIPETNPVLKQSGAVVFTGGQAGVNWYISTGSASRILYTLTPGSIQTGMIPAMHRLDGTGSGQGPISIQHGFNSIRLYVGNSIGNTDTIYGGMIYLNYESDSMGSRPLTNNHTIYNLLSGSFSMNNGALKFFYAYYTGSLVINDNNYYLDSVTSVYEMQMGKLGNAPIYTLYAGTLFYTGSTELNATLINPIQTWQVMNSNDARTETATIVNSLTPYIHRYSNIPVSGQINLKTSRYYGIRHINVTANATTNVSNWLYATYNAVTSSITGSIQNYSGVGSGISIKIYDYDSGQYLFTTQSLSGGQIQSFWYNDVKNLILFAETGSNRYASNVLPAGSGSFLITIPTASAGSPGGSTEKSFTFIG